MEHEERANSIWLREAIQHVREAEAETTTPTAENTLKRIWWCCIIRDRTMALCERRNVQILDDLASPLDYDDLSDENERSRVYTSDTKRSLHNIVILMTELCVLLTDILDLVYPADLPMSDEASLKNLARTEDCRKALRQWCSRAKRVPSSNGTIMYTNLLWMYYQYELIPVA